eukprot:EG_transcript_1719
MKENVLVPSCGRICSADDPEASPQSKLSVRSSSEADAADCPTLRFKMISKHPDFPHNKLFSVVTDESLEQLQQKISKLTSIKPNNFALFWEDADKYRFALNSNADWEEALSYFSENKSTMNLKIYVTGISPDPPWVTGPSSQIQRVRRPSGQPTIASDIVHFAEGSLSEDMISPTSFASNHVLHPDPRTPMDENIADGCDSFVTSSTATLMFNDQDSIIPESLSARFHQHPSLMGGIQQSFHQNLCSPALQQSFNQPPLNNLSFCTVVERNPTSPLCGPTDGYGQRMLWRRGRVLGKGAYGVVYLGLNQSSGELLAVKQVCIDDNENMPTQETFARLRALAQEIRMMENLQHPNIVRYLGTDRTENGIYIFMEYIPGGSIASLLKQFGPFQEKLISAYLRQILSGLNYLHGQHVLHRDIKGANILVSQKGEVKLADFGSSKSLQDIVQSTTIKNTFVGTAEWMAPEAIACKNQTKPADIWSLGCTILEMTYADTPWSRNMEERRNGIAALYYIASSHERPKIPHDILSEEACDFLNHCLQRDPNLRPTTAELLQHPWLQTVSPMPSTPGTPLSPLAAPSLQRLRPDGSHREGSPASAFIKSGESEGASIGSDEEERPRRVSPPMDQDQEDKILSYVAGEVERTLSLAELPTPFDPHHLRVQPTALKPKKMRRRPPCVMPIQTSAPPAPSSLGTPDVSATRPCGESAFEISNASMSSNSSPRCSPMSPLVNASFNSMTGGLAMDGRPNSVRCRKTRAQSQAMRLVEALEKSSFETRAHQKGLEEPETKRTFCGIALGERTMLLMLIVLLISVVLAAFAQGFCRSLGAEAKHSPAAPTPLVCLPIYNIPPPFDYFVLLICYVCIGVSAVALQSALRTVP